MSIRIINSERDIRACFHAVHQLRPDWSESKLVDQVENQSKSTGYTLVALEDARDIVACAGFRTFEILSRRKHMYIDDVVTLEGSRSKGYGGRLISWLLEHARNLGCCQIDLDSAVFRSDSHRFYFKHGFCINGFHFTRNLEKE